MIGAAALPAAADDPLVTNPASYVNTSIGNTNDGTTHPGATVPFGMIQSSPDTRVNAYAAYQYGDTSIIGFSQTHLAGVGCQTQSSFRFQPVTAFTNSASYSAYSAPFSHSNESATPGYYEVTFNNGIKTQIAASERTAIQRYTFPDGAANRAVFVDVGRQNGTSYGGQVQILTNPDGSHDTIQGYITGGNFCSESSVDRYRVHFSAKFSEPFATWSAQSSTSFNWTSQPLSASNASGSNLNAGVTFGPGTAPIEVSVALSYTTATGAELNRVTEQTLPGGQMITLEQLAAQAHDKWNAALNRIAIADSTPEVDKITFYSALYRSLVHPSLASDVDGKYTTSDMTTIYQSDKPYYQMFSLWDTYRSQNQIVAWLFPERARDMAFSLVRQADANGWAPRWTLGQGETNVMSGDSFTPWMTTLDAFGILDDDSDLRERAWQWLWTNSQGTPPAPISSKVRGRDGNPSYWENGWVNYLSTGGLPYGDRRQSGSATYEYAFGDCGLAAMGERLGHTTEARRLRSACYNFENLWNSSITDTLNDVTFTGFPSVRNLAGDWVNGTNPRNQSGWHEGTPWQYQWFAHQDWPALFSLMGGEEKALQRLDVFFGMSDVLADFATAPGKSWVGGAYAYSNNYAFNPNNESDLQAPYAYFYTNQPWKTSAIMRAARVLFTNTPTGMPGNDDLGTISSWILASMLGTFNAIPGTPNWFITAPMFAKAVITPEGSTTPFTITAPGGTSQTLQYINSATLNGQPYDHAYVSMQQIRQGGELALTLSSTPNDFGVGKVPATLGSAAQADQPALEAKAQQSTAQGSGTGLAVASVTGGRIELADVTATVDFQDGAGPIPATIVRGQRGAADIALPHSLTTPGLHAITVAATFADAAGPVDLGSVTGYVLVTLASSFEGAFNSTCLTRLGTIAYCDSGGYSFNLDDLATATPYPYVQGTTVSLTSGATAGMRVRLPVTQFGAPDNVISDGSRFRLPLASDTTKIALVGTATDAAASGTATITYTDGSTQTFTLRYGDWVGASSSPVATTAVFSRVARRQNGANA
ncbi:MAG: GH92 family glycosyl hydrolase, partial [Bifidobacteriaceae bacterium]|nr:GH92 family glycosyl hydrolase [Bifidobacteriaceae bacterium]